MINFAKECENKFYKVAKKKNRTLTPWDTHEYHFLLTRLEEELAELQQEVYECTHGIGNNQERLKSECKDVALFAWMIYKKACKNMVGDETDT
jgi:NTP pyrophosphatase (non-canonical NTP hydrolase)